MNEDMLEAIHSASPSTCAEATMANIRVRPLFAWYDLWVGAFWDRGNRRLYILPLPCLGVVIDFGEPRDATP
jgi:hypothetical protein